MQQATPLMPLSIQLLGRWQVHVGEHEVTATQWQSRHSQQLVKLLALEPEHKLHREQLMETLWPGISPDKSANHLNKALYHARRALEPDLSSGNRSRFLKRAGDSVQLAAAGTLTVDTIRFEQNAKAALRSERLELLRSAEEIYTGELLPEDQLDDCFNLQRDALSLLHQRLLRLQLDLTDADEHPNRTVELLQKLLRTDCLNENYHRQLMSHYARHGERSKSLVQFRQCEQLLSEELGDAPEDETRTLYEQIRAGKISRFKPNKTPSQGAQASEKPSLAVMPFENAGSDHEGDGQDYEYLCEGLSDELTLQLARLPDLHVIARSTVFRCRSHESDPMVLGNELSVHYLVLGRVEFQQHKLKLWVELVDTDSGSIRWAQHYDSASSDILLLRNSLSRDLTAELSVSAWLLDDDSDPRTDPTNEMAYHEYLRGRFQWNKRSGASLQQALTHFSTAIEHDPVYALAYTGLADTYNVMSLYTALSPLDTMPKARAAASQALTLNPQSCEATASLGYYALSFEWNMQDAETCFQRAITLNPNYSVAHQWYHKLLIATGRFDEAAQEIALAFKHDPLSIMITTEKAWGLYYSNRYPQAIEQLERLLTIDPAFSMAHYLLGSSYLQTEDYASAESALIKALEHRKSDVAFPLATGTLGHTYARAGKTALAMDQLAQLEKQSLGTGATAFSMALIHIAFGHLDEAFALLERACDERIDRLIFFNSDPLLDSLRPHPEFEQLRLRITAGMPSS